MFAAVASAFSGAVFYRIAFAITFGKTRKRYLGVLMIYRSRDAVARFFRSELIHTVEVAKEVKASGSVQLVPTVSADHISQVPLTPENGHYLKEHTTAESRGKSSQLGNFYTSAHVLGKS